MEEGLAARRADLTALADFVNARGRLLAQAPSLPSPIYHAINPPDPVLHGRLAHPATDWAAAFEALKVDPEFGLVSDSDEVPAA
jgi:hypothetical protein